VESRHEDLKEGDGKSTRSHASVRDEIVDDLTGLLKDGFVFSEVERQPLKHDLDEILGTPSLGCRVSGGRGGGRERWA